MQIARGIIWGKSRTFPAPVQPKPALSVVVVLYNIPREGPRTLLSLSATYQQHINRDDYEVIVVDNGSSPPIDPDMVAGLTGNFRLIRIDEVSPSPAAAINRGLAAARGDVIGVLIDGARIATPGLLHFARHGARLFESAIVTTLGWYLGCDYQRWAIRAGYDVAREDALLAQIGWPQDGYRLFEIGTLDESSVDGWLHPIAESNALFMRRAGWDLLGGADERFDLPGGGLVNLDTYRRAIELPGARQVVLLGEGTFHQLHGGIATNSPVEQMQVNWAQWSGQYSAIRGKSWQTPSPGEPRTYIGTLPRPALARFVRAALDPSGSLGEAPLGTTFDRVFWSPSRSPRSADPLIASLIDLAQGEFQARRYAACAAVARLARQRAPDEPEAQRLLSLASPWLPSALPEKRYAVEYHLALGDAHRILRANDEAASHYRTALTLDRNLVRAHMGLATLRMPGDFYYAWLARLYSSLAPETVIEIGVADGTSLALVPPNALAIGIDPAPKATVALKAATHIFPETSDAFFARRGPDALMAGGPLGVGFIDGLHLYEQVLKDFINLERYAGPRSVILLHDTIPLDEATQNRACDTQFHTGDVWKTVLCLKRYRPDLDVFTIATPWTGLTVVTSLTPGSRVLADNYDEAVARFIDLPFASIEGRMETAMNVVPNDWSVVEARLKARGVL